MSEGIGTRLFWGAALAGLCVFLWFRINWLLALSEPWLSFAQVVALLLFAVCVAGVVLPPRWAAGVQAAIGFVGLLALWGGALTSL